MIIRASFMIAATVAALAISNRAWKKQRHEPESSGDTEQRSCKRRDEEMERARLLAKDLRKRKSALEKRLLELHDAKEKYLLMVPLRRRLSAMCSEVELLESKIRELWSERNVLEEELRKSANGEEELRSARSVISGLQERIDSRKKGMGEMVREVEERVDVIRRNDGRCSVGVRIGKEEEEDDANNVKMEVLELQRTNKDLEFERRKLASKLDAARAKIRGLLRRIEDERETIAELKKEAGSLRRANEYLQKCVDQLQKERFGMVEELVYTRWLNICLRFEVEDFYEISRKNPMDSPRCDYFREWSTEYIEKTGRILGAVSNGLDLSPTSTESRRFGNLTAENSSSSSENKKKHRTLIHRIKFWGRGKKNSNEDSTLLLDENTTDRGRRIRRYSTSMIPEHRATTTESSDKAKGLSRLRRVSFNDADRNSEQPNFSTPAAETSDLVCQNICTENESGSSSDCANTSGHERNQDQEKFQAVTEVGVVAVATGGKISQLCMVIVFLLFILMITLYYRIF